MLNNDVIFSMLVFVWWCNIYFQCFLLFGVLWGDLMIKDSFCTYIYILRNIIKFYIIKYYYICMHQKYNVINIKMLIYTKDHWILWGTT